MRSRALRLGRRPSEMMMPGGRRAGRGWAQGPPTLELNNLNGAVRTVRNVARCTPNGACTVCVCILFAAIMRPLPCLLPLLIFFEGRASCSAVLRAGSLHLGPPSIEASSTPQGLFASRMP